MEKLFCIPGGGTSCVMYLGWNKYFGRDCTICPLEIPGRGYKESRPSTEDFNSIVSELQKEIEEKSEGESYSIFGFCFGGLLTYEICARIEKGDFRSPEHVYICGSTTPEPMDKTIHSPMIERPQCREEMSTMLHRFFPAYLFSDKELLKSICEKYMQAFYSKYDKYGEMMPVNADELGIGEDMLQDKTVEYILKFANSYFVNYKHDEKAAVSFYYSDKDKYKLKTPVTIICGSGDSVIGESWREWDSWADDIRDRIVLEANHFTLTQDPAKLHEVMFKYSGGTI